METKSLPFSFPYAYINNGIGIPMPLILRKTDKLETKSPGLAGPVIHGIMVSLKGSLSLVEEGFSLIVGLNQDQNDDNQEEDQLG